MNEVADVPTDEPLPWGVLTPIYQLLVHGDLTSLIVAAIILLFVGNYATTFQPKVRKVGLVIGGLVFVCFLVLLFDRSPQEFSASIITAIVRAVVVGAISTAAAWTILTLLFALGRTLVMTPVQSVTRSAQERYTSYRYEIIEARLQRENERLQEKLAAAQERVATLEARPDALPDNVDNLTRHVVAWGQERERILRDDTNDPRPNLDRTDAEYARKLAELLKQQERESRG